MKKTFLVLGVLLVVAVLLYSCGGEKKGRSSGRSDVRSDVQDAAIKTYVAPGDLDKYYIFKSGGHSGQIYIYGVPSMRHISTIPVFSPYPPRGMDLTRNPSKSWARSRGATHTIQPSVKPTATMTAAGSS